MQVSEAELRALVRAAIARHTGGEGQQGSWAEPPVDAAIVGIVDHWSDEGAVPAAPRP